jgi:Mn-dependent DtxR family transcriptional regulator
MDDRKRGDAPFLILKYLIDNGPASYEKISKDLKIPQSTVENRIMEILIKRHGLVKKLNNDRFTVKWHTDEEEAAKTFKKEAAQESTARRISSDN